MPRYTVSLDACNGNFAAAVSLDADSEAQAEARVLEAQRRGKIPWIDTAGKTHGVTLKDEDVTIDWISEEDSAWELSPTDYRGSGQVGADPSP